MQVRSFAKINWALRILGKRADGYHDLETLFQTISLHDVLDISEAGRLSLTCDDPSIPTDESNLVLRAAQALSVPPVSIHLQKRVPAGGGLGGGSANAAATLLALDEMFSLKTPRSRLLEIALNLGSDVPFFLVGGTAYATGRGEVLTPMPDVGRVPLLLLLPEERVSTADAFRRIRNYSTALGMERYRTMIEHDLFAAGNALTNDFEGPVFESMPRLHELKVRLLSAGARWASMTGSGSTIAGAFRGVVERDDAAKRFNDVRTESVETAGA